MRTHLSKVKSDVSDFGMVVATRWACLCISETFISWDLLGSYSPEIC